MVITAMVLAAMSVVTFAVANGWQSADGADSAYVTGAQVQTRMTQWFRPAAAIGAFAPGSLDGSGAPAAVFFWEADTSGDGKIEFNEIGLLQLDTATQQLRVYDASDWATWSTTAQDTANALAGTSYLSDTANMVDFMTACPKYRVVMRNVAAMKINVVTTGDKPLLEYVVTLVDSAGASSTHYGSVALRAAVAASN
jgi:hypothetical protein